MITSEEVRCFRGYHSWFHRPSDIWWWSCM